MDVYKYLRKRLGVPDNWDKFDYEIQRYSLDDMAEVLHDVVNKNAVLHSVMPSLHIFKERREKLKLTLRQVAKETKVSAATISRIERAEGECSYHNVVQLDDFYCRNGA